MPEWILQWFRDLVDWIRRYIYSVIALFLDQVHAEETWVETLREAEARGSVVHVIRSVHLFDSLCIHRLCINHGLHDIGFVYGLEGWFLRPLRWIYRFMMKQGRGVEDRIHLEAVLEGGRSAILCLRRSPKTFHSRGEEIGAEAIGWLKQYAARSGGEVILVPHAFVWGRHPAGEGTSVIDRIFGSEESPGILRGVLQFARARRTVTIRTCPAVTIGKPEMGDAELRDDLARTLDRMRRTVTGPTPMSQYRTADRIMSDPALVDELSRISAEQSRPMAQVSGEAERELGRLMARPFPAAVDLLDVIFNRVWPILYDGIEVDAAELDRVRRAVEKGPLVILPTHRSHVDYILLSWIFYHAHIPLPYIAAGRNLSFWPLSTVFGGCNAFFIPRTLAGRDVERAVLRAYAHHLISEGCHVEIFLEGTRSRSGKMLPLHTGLLEMFLERAREIDDLNLSLLPVSICYERVIEEGSYAGEQMGGSKEPEGLGGLLRTSDVLASAYGRLVVHFGAPLELRSIEAKDPDAGSPRSVKRIAYRLAWEMNGLEALTPTGLVATVLLQCPPLGVDERMLFDYARFYLEVLVAVGKPLASALGSCLHLAPGDLGREDVPAFVQFRETLYQAIHLLAEDDLVRISGLAGSAVYSVPAERRIRLDYYRNGATGLLAAPAIVCRVQKTLGRAKPAARSEVQRAARSLSKLLRYEFVFDASRSFDENFDRTLAFLEARSIVRERGDTLECVDRVAMDRLAASVEPVLETYRLTALALSDVRRRMPLPEWEAVIRTFALHDRLYLEGSALFPESRNRSAVRLALRSLTEMGALPASGPRHFALGEDGAAARRLLEIARLTEGGPVTSGE